MTKTTEIELMDDEGGEYTVEVSFKWEICPYCSGEGHVDNPAFSDGISGEDWANEWDEDEREAYMSGRYDVTCEECDGSGKIQEPDVSTLTEDAQRHYEEKCQQEYYNARERDAERRWGY